MDEEARTGRRASRAGSLRRRRLGGGLVGLAVVAGAAVALSAGGAPSHRARVGPPPPATPGHGSEQAALARLAAIGLPVYCGGRSKPMVALTFDDGPGQYTELAIKKLRAHHLRATFFLVGRSIIDYPGVARLERAVGAVGDHTMTHPFLPGVPQAEMVAQIGAAKTLIETSSGQRVELFRPPYEAHSPAIDAEVRALGLVDVLWTVDSRDSLGADYAGIARNVIAGLHPGSIILLHENRGQTIRALGQIIPALRRKHLHAVTVPGLLSADPPSEAQLRAGGLGCGVRVPAAGTGT